VRPLITDWLRQLGRAVSARHLYPADHPRVIEAVAMLTDLSQQLTAEHPEVTSFMLDGRLTCDGALVPGADAAAERAFGFVNARGYDCITLRRGVERGELGQLVGILAGADHPAPDDPRLRSTAHVRFSVFDVGSRRPSAAPTVTQAGLADLWQLIDEQHTLDVDALETLLAPLVQIADPRQSSILPLATLKSHDDYTATHITNVAMLTMALADRAGLPPAFIRQIGIAALLHDIGKIRIPTAILNYAGPLTADEIATVRRHPIDGARMLMATPGIPQMAVVVAYEHHLQADGGGYPTVPRGWRIHLASQLTHVADVYDALRSNRPYRRAWSHDRIVDAMTRDRGTVFPAALVDLFLTEVVPRTRVDDAGPPLLQPAESAPAPGAATTDTDFRDV
jgi:HD-GYP domain-containing protein (c-di-GMP phosphodiesterase class II)